MIPKKPSIAKITQPRISGALVRERLFRMLDRGRDNPVIWISAPAGAGKTTLIAGYLASRKLPCLWYQVDAGDGDLATFFYYMGLAAQKAGARKKQPLPLLTPEYLGNIPIFTRRYFEALYSSLKPPFVVVFDNYQEATADPQFHDMTATGLEAIPEGIQVIIISRTGPPPFSRLMANNSIRSLGWDELRFTPEESEELIKAGVRRGLSVSTANEVWEKTRGWAAGMILMLGRAKLKGAGPAEVTDLSPEGVFEYFAGEIFNRSEKEVREFLLKTAFLPAVSVPMAQKLTGIEHAGRILATLNRQNFFTDRLSGQGQDYQYHPLFRDFLLNRAKTEFAPRTLAALLGKTALLLEQAGQREDAARLYCSAGDSEGLCRMVLRHARELRMQGRSRTLEEWIACIPDAAAEKNPWIIYWSGMCSFPVELSRTRIYLEKAFELFKAVDDVSGVYLSWAGIVDTYAFGLDDWKQLDDCIAVFEDLRKKYPAFPTKEIDLIASSRMLTALTLRKTDQPKTVQRWLDRISVLLQENPSFDIQMDTLFSMSVFYLWKGEYDKNTLLLEREEAEIPRQKLAPFAIIRIKMMVGVHHWITGRYDSALQALSEGLDLSGKSGVHVFDSLLWGFSAAAEMAQSNLDRAEQLLKNQMASLAGEGNTLDVYFYHVNSAWYALLKGNPALAAENLETISARTTSLGTPYYRCLLSIGMAQAAFKLGRSRDAKTHIRTAHRMSLAMKSDVMEWYSLLIEAYFSLQEGRSKEGLSMLERALAIGRKHAYVHLEFYQPAVMQFLCAQALEQGMEREYVIGLIRKLGLTPPGLSLLPLDKGRLGGVSCIDDWPYPIKVHTLGRFEILKDGKPLAFSGKVQKKPLEMLMALIAFGGSNVPEERLTSALWPDAEGDLARKSFETTLSRLRRLLGGEACITCSARQLTVNSHYCWVDSQVLERIIEMLQECPADQKQLLCKKAMALYKGPFLPSDTDLPWALSSREMLQNRLLRVLIATGHDAEQAGEWNKAVEYYEKGIEIDCLAEEAYQRLMFCYQRLGKRAEAAALYKRCCRQLQAHLGIEPSPETTAIYAATVGKKE